MDLKLTDVLDFVIKMFFTSYISCKLRLLLLKTESQTGPNNINGKSQRYVTNLKLKFWLILG